MRAVGTEARRSRPANLLVAVASVLVLALLAAGCGTDTDTATSTGAGPATEAPATDDPTTTAPPSTDVPTTTGAEAPAEITGSAPTAPLGGELEVSFLDVGQGDATLLRTDDATVLIDTGRHDREDVVEHLRFRGVEAIDVVVITHGHADHIGQLDRILASVDVGEVWMSGTPHTSATFERAVDAIADAGVVYEEPRAGASTTVGSLAVDVVHPAGLTGDLHGDSLSVRVGFGAVSFLFTGDAEADTEAELVARDRALVAATVYQVGHHGSTTSTTAGFLAAVDPEVAVYSAGSGNTYGHPHDEVVDRITGAGVDHYGTDVHGTVTVTTDGVTYTVATDGPAGPTEGATDPAAPRAPPTTAATPASPPPAAAPPPAGGCGPERVDVNRAPPAELEAIIHVGAERAGQIVALRPFSSVDDLTRVNGLGDARVADIIREGVACVP